MEYITNDFYSAVVLKVMKFSLLRLEKQNAKFVNFVFQDDKGTAEELLKRYWDRDGVRPEARDLIETINELKSRIYQVT